MYKSFPFVLKDARVIFGISCWTLVEVRLGLEREGNISNLKALNYNETNSYCTLPL